MKKNKKKIIFCKRCLYASTHPLGIIINEEGICSGCIVHEEKNKIFWPDKIEKLKKIIKNYKIKSNKFYDCIVPVTGGSDSYYIVHVVKYILKMNPLLVCYNKYWNTPVGIKNLANLRIKFNCDIIFQNVNPILVKKITKETLYQIGSIYWHSLAGSTVFPVKISTKYQIPLIIWGAHQGLEQVGMFSHDHEVEMTRRYRKNHDLLGTEAEDLLKISNNLCESDLVEYFYPDDYTLRKNSTRGIYLGNFMRWDTKKQHEEMIKKYNYKTYNFSRTMDCYDYVDSFNYLNLHDKIKMLKHGYSKVTDQLSREIRFNRIDRDSALKLVRKFENKKINFEKHFLDWISIDKHAFDYFLNKLKNKQFWTQIDVDKWTCNSLSKQNSFSNTKKINKLKYTSNSKLSKNSKYVTIGKGMNVYDEIL